MSFNPLFQLVNCQSAYLIPKRSVDYVSEACKMLGEQQLSESDLLIGFASQRSFPSAPVFSTFSDPARSTR